MLNTEVKHSESWVSLPVVRQGDKTLVYYTENIEGIPFHVTMELNMEKEIVNKYAIPLNEIWA